MESKLSLAGCVIKDENDRILLIHRNTPKRTQWEIPGGKIEEKEQPKQTAIREVTEELGVKVKIVKKLGKKDFQEDNFMMSYTWFLAEIENGMPKLMEEKYDNLEYFSVAQLKKMQDQLSPNTNNFLKYCC